MSIHASVESRGGQVRVRVCDRGPGVPAAYRERIFEAFFRLPGHAENAKAAWAWAFRWCARSPNAMAAACAASRVKAAAAALCWNFQRFRA
jgi:hypothetical protein